MASSQSVYLNANEVRDRAIPILRKYLGKFGFNDAKVEEEEDFDGAYVFRMTAHVESRVPARDLIDALEEIHTALRKEGEDRFVYLSTERPRASDIDEADDEDQA